MGVLVAVLLGACARAPPVVVAEAPREVWVDAFAPEGGDGSRGAALKQVPVLGAAAHLHLRSGLYRGPFVFPPGSQVEGHGEVVLFDEGAGPVATSEGPLSLQRLSVQGGRVGVLANAPLVLEQVKFSGHRVAAVQVIDAGVTGQQLEVTARVDGVIGLDATNASVSLRAVKLLGPLAQGVRARDSTVALAQVTSEGPATAVQTLGGALELDGLRAAGGMRTAISVTGTRARLSGLEVTGHEYAVLGRGGELQVDGLLARGPQRGGVSMLDAAVRLSKVTVERAGGLGGAQLMGCTSQVQSLTVRDTQAWGLFVRKGRATVTELTAEGIRGEPGVDGAMGLGDALHVRDAEVEVARLVARGLDGAGLYASSFAVVKAGSLEVSGAGTGAVVVDRKSVVTAERVTSRGNRGPALAAPEDGLLSVDVLDAQGGDVTVWADCATGSFVTVKAVAPGTELPRLRCLQGPLRPQ